MPSRRWVLAWLPAASYMALIWALSSMPILVPISGVPFKDKGVHFVEYGVLAVLLGHALYSGRRTPSLRFALFYGFVVATFWGMVDEIHQAYVPGRSSDPMDVLADTMGAALGTLCFAGWVRFRSGRDRPPPTVA